MAKIPWRGSLLQLLMQALAGVKLSAVKESFHNNINHK